MSTKASISYDPDHHLYQDAMDGFSTDPRVWGRLWLEMTGVEAAMAAGEDGKNVTVTVELPPVVVKALRDHLCAKLEEKVAHLLWAMENGLTDVKGAKLDVKDMIPEGALARYNARYGTGAEE